MTEHLKARAFREALALTIEQLSTFTGYGEQSIYLFERGANARGQPHPPRAWQRYKMACLAVEVLHNYRVQSVEQWDWTHKA